MDGLQKELNNPSVLIYIHMFICAHLLGVYLAFLQFLKIVKTDRSQLHYGTELNLVICTQAKFTLISVRELQEHTGCHAVVNVVCSKVLLLT